MIFLVAVVVLLSVMTIFNLLLTVAVFRRIKQSEKRSVSASEESEFPDLPAGSSIPEFRAESISGGIVTSEGVAGAESVFAFFDTGCSVCRTTVPQLVEYARERGLKPDQVVAVIGGDRHLTAPYVEPLDGVATVIVEETLGPVASAFAIPGIPAFVLTDDQGTVVRAGSSRSTLSVHV